MTETKEVHEFAVGDYVRVNADHISKILDVPAQFTGKLGQITEVRLPGPVPIVKFPFDDGEYSFGPDEVEFICRPLRLVAREILQLWKEKRPSQATFAYAMPYIEAMLFMDKPSDSYGMESGDMIVAYLQNNLRNWRGEDARRIKAELTRCLEAYNDGSLR
ncbi:hypothetical protein SEA_XENIA2_54 [Gordonia phage Xenia2]